MPARWVAAAFLCAATVGLGAALTYHAQGLTLSHYDAKAHLVVSRRIIDSLTPGWEQIGAVWLPLPHLVQMLPVQIDALYRTGAFAVFLSIAGFAAAAAGTAFLTLRATRSAPAAACGAAIFALNPNILYLQSTPMTEAMLLGLVVMATAAVYEWTESDGRASPRLPGALIFAACWTRYEAWPVTGALVALSAAALLRRGVSLPDTCRRVAGLAAWPFAAGITFLLLSRATVGEWFVTGFFVPDNPSRGSIELTLRDMLKGTRQLGGDTIVDAATAAAVVVVVLAIAVRGRAALLVTLAPLAAGLLPFYAFFKGHPYRIRYMVPVVAASALAAAVGAGLTKRAAWLLAPLLVFFAVREVPPFDARAAMVQEAQWDRPASRAREELTGCLRDRLPDEKILMSMGSLAHYMHELSQHGYRLADFIHEGNHPIWDEVILLPRRHVVWMVMDEESEGGDWLAGLTRTSSHFLDGFTRVCKAAGIAVYRRDSP